MESAAQRRFVEACLCHVSQVRLCHEQGAGQLHSLFEPDLQPQDEEKCAKKEAEDPSCDQLLCAKRAAGQLQSDWTSEDIVAVELIGCPAKLQL